MTFSVRHILPPSAEGPTLLGLLLPILLLTGTALLSGCSAQKVNVPELRRANAETELPIVRALPSSPGGPVTLQEAVIYALEHNLDTKVREIEQAVQEEFLTGRKMEMLPSLLAEASLSGRSENPGIRAESVDTGEETLPPSIFSNKFTDRSRIYLAWDLLDFGVTYYRSRQALNRLTIMEEQTRRAKQQLVREVTRAYGRALVAWEALNSAREILAEHNARLTRSREVDQADISAVNLSLEKEIDSLEHIEEISRFEREYNAAQAELSRLMGLAPGSRVELVEMNTSTLPPALDVRIKEWEREAVLNRAELSEKDIMEKITEDEANIAFAQMFPNPGMILGFQREGNTFLTVNDWFSVGLTVSWNLLSIPRRLSEKRQAELEGEVIAMKRVSLTMAIMAQVNMAALEYQDSIKRYLLKEDIAARRERLVQGLGNDPEADPDRILEEKTEALYARLAGLQAYMEILEARETVYAGLGRDPYEDRGYAGIQTSVNPPLLPAMRRNLRPDAEEADSAAETVDVRDIEERILRENNAVPEAEDEGGNAPNAGPKRTTGSAPSAARAPAEKIALRVPEQHVPAEKIHVRRNAPTRSAGITQVSGVSAGDVIPFRSRKKRSQQFSMPAAPTPPAAPGIKLPTAAAAPISAAAPTPAVAPTAPQQLIETRIFYEPGTGPGRVRITSGTPLKVENFVRLSDPERLVVNVAGTGPWRGPSRLPARGGLSSIRVHPRSNGLRLILELTPEGAGSPRFENTESGLSIILQKG